MKFIISIIIVFCYFTGYGLPNRANAENQENINTDSGSYFLLFEEKGDPVITEIANQYLRLTLSAKYKGKPSLVKWVLESLAKQARSHWDTQKNTVCTNDKEKQCEIYLYLVGYSTRINQSAFVSH